MLCVNMKYLVTAVLRTEFCVCLFILIRIGDSCNIQFILALESGQRIERYFFILFLSFSIDSLENTSVDGVLFDM